MKRIFSLITVMLILSLSVLPVFAADDWSQLSSEELTATPGETMLIEESVVAEDVASDNVTTESTLSPTDGTSSSDYHVPGRNSYVDNDEGRKILAGYEDVMPNVTTDDLLQWATTKGNEIIYLLQVFCQPFAIIIFIVAAFMTLIGSIGKGDLVGKGVWGMVCSCLVYAGVLYAPVILQTFVGWVAS